MPLLLALLGALQPPLLLRASPGRLGFTALTTESFRELFRGEFSVWLVNSLIVGTTAGGVTLAASLPLALGATRWRGGLCGATIRAALGAYFVPSTFLIFPLLEIAVRLSFRDSCVFVGVIAGALSMPIASWLLKSQFDLVPPVLLEMAELDGLGTWAILGRVVLPYCWRGVVGVGFFAFAVGWGEYSVSLAILARPSVFTVSLGVPHLLDGDVWMWDQVLAAALTASAPPLAGLLAIKLRTAR